MEREEVLLHYSWNRETSLKVHEGGGIIQRREQNSMTPTIVCLGSSIEDEQLQHDLCFPIFMESDLWTLFPSELLDFVLARLPLPSLLRFRLVCKKWASLLLSPAFACRWTQCAPPASPWAIFTMDSSDSISDSAQPLQPPGNAVSDAVRKWWKKNSIKFRAAHEENAQVVSLPRLKWHTLGLEFCLGSSPLFRCLSSSGGLLLLSVSEASLLVVNPVTKAWTKLQPFCDKFVQSVCHKFLAALVADQAVKSYKVITAEPVGAHFMCHVYDSTSKTWRRTGSLPPFDDKFSTFPRAVLCEGVLYWLAGPLILAFDVQQESWSTIPARSARNAQLLEHQGRLKEVVLEEGRIAIWEFHNEGNRWVETDRIAQVGCEIFRTGLIQCTKIGDDLLCFNTFGGNQVFIYHMTFKRGHWSLRCPYSPALLSNSFPFQPRLDAFV